MFADELQRIFMYYCSFGDNLNLDLMSASKFAKFVRDIQLAEYGIRNEDADLMFVKIMKSKSIKISLTGMDDKSQKMAFPYFVEALKTISVRVFPKLHPTKALVTLLAQHVLPHAKQMPEKFTNVNLADKLVKEKLAHVQRCMITVCISKLQSYFIVICCLLRCINT